MTNISDQLGLFLGSREEFVQEIVKKLKIKDKNGFLHPSIIKESLEIILNICSRHKNPGHFIDRNQLYNILVTILHYAQKNKLVILEQILDYLLDLYSKSNSQHQSSKLSTSSNSQSYHNLHSSHANNNTSLNKFPTQSYNRHNQL